MSESDIVRWAVARTEELPGAVLEHPFGPEHDVYQVGGKVFMLCTVLGESTELAKQLALGGKPVVTLKSRPADGAVLREAYPEIIPGYHMNKRHWITIRPGATLDEGLVRDLVTESYLLVVETLPRAQRPVNPDTFGQL